MFDVSTGYGKTTSEQEVLPYFIHCDAPSWMVVAFTSILAIIRGLGKAAGPFIAGS